MAKIKNSQIDLFNKNDIGYDILIAPGASNIVGFGRGIDMNYDFTHPRVFQYPASGDYLNKIIQAREPLMHVDITERPNAVGAFLTMGRLFADILPTNRKVLIIPCALQGTTFADGNWNPGDSYYVQMVTRINGVMSAYPKSRILLTAWTTGGNDRFLTSTDLKSKIDAFFNGMRSSITGASNMPVIVFGSTQQSTDADSDRARMVADILDTPNRLVRVASITVSDLTSNDQVRGDGDTIHFSAIAQRTIGDRVFQKYMELFY